MSFLCPPFSCFSCVLVPSGASANESHSRVADGRGPDCWSWRGLFLLGVARDRVEMVQHVFDRFDDFRIDVDVVAALADPGRYVLHLNFAIV